MEAIATIIWLAAVGSFVTLIGIAWNNERSGDGP
jgi:hypothetical protein